jgi:hypothetical protein
VEQPLRYNPLNGVSTGSDYVFEDGDALLLTDATDEKEVQNQLSAMTHDACLYSQTCPERGKPPVENCVADPTVPCTEQ